MAEKDYQTYELIHTQSDVSALLEDVLKTKVAVVERINYGEVNAVYSIQADDDKYILKVAPYGRGKNNLLQEAWAFTKCRSVGVPVPEVVGVDSSLRRFPEAYLLTKKIPGTPGGEIKFTDEDAIDLMHQLGHNLYLIHSITVSGFGEIDQIGGQFRGIHDTLWQSVISDFESSWWVDVLTAHGLISIEDLEKYREVLEKHKDLFSLETASLTHGDIGPRNLIMEGNKIVGIVDMENVLATDPVRDFHWFGYWIKGSQRLKALQDGYDNKNLFDNDFLLKMRLYQIIHSLLALAYYQSRNNITALNYLQGKIREADQFLGLLT